VIVSRYDKLQRGGWCRTGRILAAPEQDQILQPQDAYDRNEEPDLLAHASDVLARNTRRVSVWVTNLQESSVNDITPNERGLTANMAMIMIFLRRFMFICPTRMNGKISLCLRQKPRRVSAEDILAIKLT